MRRRIIGIKTRIELATPGPGLGLARWLLSLLQPLLLLRLALLHLLRLLRRCATLERSTG